MAQILNSSTRESIVKALRTGMATPQEITMEFGVNYMDIQGLLEAYGVDLGPFECLPYIVAIRSRENCLWPLGAASSIANAKDQHDRGISNMTYYYGGLYMVMYNFPRKTKVVRKPWFQGV